MVIPISCRTYLWSQCRICAHVHISSVWSYAKLLLRVKHSWPWHDPYLGASFLHCSIEILWQLAWGLLRNGSDKSNTTPLLEKLHVRIQSQDQLVVCLLKILKMRCIICILSKDPKMHAAVTLFPQLVRTSESVWVRDVVGSEHPAPYGCLYLLHCFIWFLFIDFNSEEIIVVERWQNCHWTDVTVLRLGLKLQRLYTVGDKLLATPWLPAIYGN